jgi:serine/threonine protein kinase
VPVTPLRPADPVQVGPHRLLGWLGQGGMGTVFLGVSPDERAVAVKVLRDSPLHAAGDPEARRRFRHELAALRRVRGPHLVEVLDADVDADLPYLVTRFVPGRRLDELVTDDGPLQGDALDRIARGIADALATLHTAGVVHRDLTPGNVLVLDGQPHVIDLGLAIAADVTALTRSGLVIGTPGYLAPEQVTGAAVTEAVDVHAWGATVALAGTGRPPFGTGRPEAVLYRIVHEGPDLDGLPRQLRELVEAAMDPDPRARPAASALLAELGGASSSAETVALHLPRDVDATTLLATNLLQPRPELVAAGSGPRPTLRLDAQPAPPPAEPPPAEPPPAEPPPSEPPPYDPAAYEPPHPLDEPYDQDAEVLPWSADELDAARPRAHPARSAQVAATSTAAVAVVAAGALVAPVVTGAVVLVALVALRAVGRSAQRLALRRERRGALRRDPWLAVAGAPWHLVAALVDTLVAVPLMAVAAAVPAGAIWLLDPTFNGLERAELAAATATVIALLVCLSRRAHRPSRLLLRRALVTATPGTAGAVAVLAALSASAVLLLAAAEGAAPTWWPVTALR